MGTETPRACRVFIVDDHPAVREGLAVLLERRHIAICGAADDAVRALASIEAAQPDVVLVDLSLERGCGETLVEQLHSRGVTALVYSMHEDSMRVKRAFAAGASGYVTKREGAQVLTQAIREVVAGRRYLSERVRDSLLEAGERSVTAGAPRVNLSDREALVLRRLGDGDSNEEIGRMLHISPRTVETYCYRIMEKLGLTGMKELRRYAIQQAHQGADPGN